VHQGALMVFNPGIHDLRGGLRRRTSRDHRAALGQAQARQPGWWSRKIHLFNRFFQGLRRRGILRQQMRITLRNCGIIDPENIDDYLALRGYEALAKALTEMTPQQVIAEVKKSGLRAAVGLAFPPGSVGAHGQGEGP